MESLDREGRAQVLVPRRVRVQARQIYCFAKAAKMGWYPQGREIALRGLDYLLSKARSPDGEPGFVHVLSSEGAAIDPSRDTYDHAFVLLALSTVYSLDRDAQIRAEMVALCHFLDTQLSSPNGGFVEGRPARIPRRQNPQMHLFEAMIAAFDATHDDGFRSRARKLFWLFVTKLYDQQRQSLGEYFTENWLPIEPILIEPGHQAEWVWLLKGFERVTKCQTQQLRSKLLASTLRYCDATGCLVDEGDVAGDIRRHTRRLWPQTELAKAWIAQAESGEARATDQARLALERFEHHYLSHPVSGGWYDQFDRYGNSLRNDIPASSFYHILSAVTEAELVLRNGSADVAGAGI